MNGFLRAAVVAASTVALASLLAPEGKNKKWVRFLFSLVAFSILAASVAGLSPSDMGEWADTLPPAEADQGQAEDYLFRTAEHALAAALAEELGLAAATVTVRLDEKATPKTAAVTLPKGADTGRALTFLQKQLGADWEVTAIGR